MKKARIRSATIARAKAWRLRCVKRVQAKAKQTAKKAKKAVAAALALELSHPLNYDLDKVGRVGWKSRAFVKYRTAALDKLKSLSPPLPAHVESQWHILVERYVVKMPRRKKKNIGQYFRNVVLQVARCLGVHFKGPQKGLIVGAPSDPKAFETFVVYMNKWKLAEQTEK